MGEGHQGRFEWRLGRASQRRLERVATLKRGPSTCIRFEAGQGVRSTLLVRKAFERLTNAQISSRRILYAASNRILTLSTSGRFCRVIQLLVRSPSFSKVRTNGSVSAITCGKRFNCLIPLKCLHKKSKYSEVWLGSTEPKETSV